MKSSATISEALRASIKLAHPSWNLSSCQINEIMGFAFQRFSQSINQSIRNFSEWL